MASGKRNQLKNEIKEEVIKDDVLDDEGFEEVAVKHVNTPKKKATKPTFKQKFASYFEFIQNEKFQQVTGLVLLLFAAYSFIAFLSFLFTWQNDQDKILGAWNEFFSEQVTIDNWLGKLGALLSYLFVHRWFGVVSFIFPLLFTLIGVRLLFKVSLLPFGKTLKYSFFALVWVSITLGYFFSDSYFFLGGGYGYSINAWLHAVVGSLGTAALLFISFMIFLVVNFNISFKLAKDPEPVVENMKPEPEELKLEIEKPNVINSYKEQEISPVQELILDPVDEESEEEEDSAIELEPEVDEQEEVVIDNGDVQFTVEKAEEKSGATEEPVDETNIPFGDYDPTLDLSSYQLPSIDLLQEYGGNKEPNVNADELNENKNKIVSTLANYNIQIEKIKATIGPTVTLYEIIPAAGVRISKIKNLEDDIALSLSALGIRIIAPIPGKGTIGIEVPNQNPETVAMRTIIASDKFQNTGMELPLALGKTISNETFIVDLTKMPHMLMAGATGQGKSVGLNAVLVSLLYKKHPSQIKFVLVDPKKVELTLFNKIERHFLAKLPDTEEAIITDTKKVVNTLNSLCIEMDNRYDLLKDAQVRNIKEYNAKFIARKLNPNNGHKYLPYIILVVDEFADLIMTAGKEVETPIARLAQLARAIGIHLIIATQRPSVNIITGTIKANFPARIAFRVTSRIDSRTILDSGGAEQLIGRGDMLLSTGSDLIRLQCAFVDTPEVERITDFIGSQRSYPQAFQLPEYVGDESEGGKGELDPSERDAMFNEAAKVIVTHQQGSASLLQRKLKLGYNRAGRIVDQLEAVGIIGPFEGSRAREVLIKDLASLEQFLKDMDKPRENL